MGKEVHQPQISIEIDKLYQDDALSLLASLPVGQLAQINFLDGKDIAKVLLEAANESSEVFEEAQLALVYGSPETTEHKRPNITTREALFLSLIEAGFHVESNVDEEAIDSCRKRHIIVQKTLDKALSSTDSHMIESGLPEYTNDFYPVRVDETGAAKHQMRQLFPMPRVLNIGSGSDKAKQLPNAVNIDISATGSPDIVADGIQLPFRDGSFTVVMASHVLEHFTPSQIPSVLKEWSRVLHPKGVLRVAVPDGIKTLNELKVSVTSNNEPSYCMPGSSAPLTQLLGLGGENSKTDPRWRHHILFTGELLVSKLKEAGLIEVATYRKDEALTFLSGIDMDETNSYSLRLEAKRKTEPHRVSNEVTEEEYQSLKGEVTWEEAEPLSIIVPVNNEEDVLPSFLNHLDDTLKELDSLGLNYEIIFILNGNTDNSPSIVWEFAKLMDSGKIKISESEKGIMNAFRKGLQEREKIGFVSKIDVDTAFDYWTIPLMISELLSDREKQVTYAEVKPLEDEPNRFNMGEFYQEFRSTRLYYHGRVSLYRSSPFEHFPEELVAETGVLVEDMVLSNLYAYYFGLDSMGPAKGAFARSMHRTSFDMDIRKFDRCRTEIEKIEKVFPHLRILSTVMKRVATPPEIVSDRSSKDLRATMWPAYHDLHNAMTKISALKDGITSQASEWERIR